MSGDNSTGDFSEVNSTGALTLSFFIFLLSALVIFCNVLLIAVIIRTPVLHTKTNVLILSICSSELLMGIFVISFNAASRIHNFWNFSTSVCQLVGFVEVLSVSSKALGLMAVCIDRSIAITQPLRYSDIVTKKTIIVFVVYVWFHSFVFALVPILAGGCYAYNSIFFMCMTDIYYCTAYVIVKEIGCVLIPSVVIVSCLLAVACEARSHHRIIAIAQLNLAVYSSSPSLPGIGYTRSTIKAMRTFFLITAFFIIFCLPKPVYVLYLSLTLTDVSLTTSSLLTFAAFFCCVTTPVTIASLNAKFRESITLLFKKRQSRIHPIGDKEPFTISTGLQTVLEASVVVHWLPMKIESQSGSVFVPQVRRPRPLIKLPSVPDSISQPSTSKQHATLRKTLSSPDCTPPTPLGTPSASESKSLD